MRCVIQRVAQASVSVAGEQIGTIQQGFMVLIGVSTDDTDYDVHYMAEKVPNLRIFEDKAGKMNRSLKDVGGAILAVSQFTLYGDARGGRRPSFIAATRRTFPRGYAGVARQRRACDDFDGFHQGILTQEDRAMLQMKEVTVGAIGTCCYILWDDARTDCVVIDPGDEPEHIRKAADGRTIAAILLTHGHFDHIGAVRALMTPETELVIHVQDAPMLSNPQENASFLMGAPVTAPEATKLVHEGDTVTAAGLTFTVLHTPGHTAGSVCYQIGEKLFTGDTLFRFGCGRTDLPTGSSEQMQASLARVVPMARNLEIYPGHGD